MSTYDITLTDPLSSGFTIQPGAFDGPGGSRSNTTLRLYGRGALEWGEAVDENLVRLAETFAGATAPLNPLPGQLWMRVRYYWHDTSATATTGWWFYNPAINAATNLPTGWQRLNSTGTISSVAATNPTIGSYYFDATTSILYRWDAAYKQAAAAWMPRAFSSSNLGGAAPTVQPEQDLRVWDRYSNGGAGQWVPPVTTSSSTIAPQQPQVGALWFDTANQTLKFWNGSSWVVLVGGNGSSLTIPTLSLTGDINMQSHRITNLVMSVNATPSEAANKSYVDATISSSLGSSGFAADNAVVHKSGDTMSGTLNMSNNTISSVAAPVGANDATNKHYVDTTVSQAITRLGTIVAPSTTPTIYTSLVSSNKAGDIAIVGGNIYIAVAANAWRQVWPPLYQ